VTIFLLRILIIIKYFEIIKLLICNNYKKKACPDMISRNADSCQHDIKKLGLKLLSGSQTLLKTIQNSAFGFMFCVIITGKTVLFPQTASTSLYSQLRRNVFSVS
jgi:hypothetical protein